MNQLPAPELQSGRLRAGLERLVNDQGPNPRREVDCLKLHSLGPRGQAVLAAAETGGLAVPVAGQLTSHEGDTTLLCWLFEVSRLDGDDRF